MIKPFCVTHFVPRLTNGGLEKIILELMLRAQDIEEFQLLFVSDVLEHDTNFVKGNILRIISKKKKLSVIQRIFNLRKYLKNQNTQVIHTHSLDTFIIAFFATINLKIKRVLTIHGFHYYTHQYMTKLSLFLSDTTVFVSRYQQLEFIERFKNLKFKSRVIENFYSTPLSIAHAEETDDVLNNLKDYEVIITMISSFSKDKDQFTVLKAFEILFQKRRKVKLLFVGRGNEMGNVNFRKIYNYCSSKNLLENVSFLGNRYDILNIMKKSHILVFSSILETFGIALLEGLICHKFVIANDIGAFLEVTEKGKYCQIFQSGNFAELSYYIDQILINQLETCTEQDRLYLQEKYSFQNHVSKLNKLYSALLTH